MNIEKLFSYIKSSYKQSSIKFELRDISYGDLYYNESGEEFNFTILGKDYSVGYSYITEDSDDWAQAECHQVYWCRCDDNHIDVDIVYELIQNYKSELRNSKIEDLLNGY